MNKYNGKVKRIAIIALGMIFISTQGPSMGTAAVASGVKSDLTAKTAAPVLTLKDALEQAFKNNKTIITTKNQWQAKVLEIENLQEKIRNLGKSQGGLKLETLETLEADETKRKPYLEEVTLLRSLSQKQDEMKALELAYDSAINTMTYNVKVLFYDILENTEAYNYEVENSKKLEETYVKIYPQYLQGLVKEEIVKGNRENYKASQERQVKTLLAIDQLKAKLTTQLGGKDIGSWSYEGKLPEWSLSEETLSQLYPYAVHQDAQLLTLKRNRDVAQCLLEEVNAIYLQAYGSEAQWIFPVIREEKVDYPLLFQNFKSMTEAKSKEGLKETYPLRYGFFKVDALTEYFKEKPAALTLMAEQSPLTEALSQREEKKGLVTEGYITLQKNYRAAFEAYKQLAFDLEQLRESLIIHTALLEKLKKSNLQGLTHYSEVQTLMLKVSDQKRSERVLHIKRNKSIAELDFVSAGAVRQLGALEAYEKVEGNLKPVVKPTLEILWQVDTPGDYYGFVFSLKVPGVLKATHYQLFDPEGKALGEPVAIKSSFRHEGLKYPKDSPLKVVIYQKGQAIKTGILSGEDVSGRF